jgi:hypothetical protein
MFFDTSIFIFFLAVVVSSSQSAFPALQGTP